MTPTPPQDDDEDDGSRRTTNLLLVVFFLAVVAAGYWLVDAMVAQRQADDCAAQGRRNCGAPLIVPPPR
ncbi:hypothetical protein [Rhodoplanes roseus]|uniref:Uncharacterized protein n=1 Tax=Rhodoplanes roseus TaxID=29409 RepID=A0A327L6L6_9BRAD|nr:hypothetical protein [Rhodoplanes roseus]RAI43278.1 hypothetical protein CH341_15205 [Rhodoplanes roseus]